MTQINESFPSKNHIEYLLRYDHEMVKKSLRNIESDIWAKDPLGIRYWFCSELAYFLLDLSRALLTISPRFNKIGYLYLGRFSRHLLINR